MVYCTLYFVLKGRELRDREFGGLYHSHNLEFCSLEVLGGSEGGQHFYTFFPITEGSMNGTLLL